GQLLERIEPDGEHDGVGLRDRLFDRGGAREVTQLLRERCCVRLVLRREDDGLAAADEIPRQRSTDVADSDDRGCHGDSSFYLTPQLTTRTHLTFPPPRLGGITTNGDRRRVLAVVIDCAHLAA